MPRDQPQPGSYLNKREEPGNEVGSTTAKDLVISAKISEVNVIFNVILMFEVSRLPATC